MNPCLFQFHTRPFLHSLGARATLDDISDDLLRNLAAAGFDWVWLLGVWQLGAIGPEISRSMAAWRAEHQRALSDLTDNDIGGSPFAIASYTVDTTLGGPSALQRLRARMKQFGLNLMLDFVPNHVAIDHPWVERFPNYFIHGSEDQLLAHPNCWIRVPSGQVLAYGRDPNYPGWPDTLQLNYFDSSLRCEMRAVLRSIADQCDGVRCDMAMLLQPRIFTRTWGAIVQHDEESMSPFWPEAIASIRAAHPHFLFMAEVYWEMEYELQQQGFDYTYDKVLYDRLIHRDIPGIRSHLGADLGYQKKMVRFLENHDEPRIAALTGVDQHRAAATLTFLAPGMRFIQMGEREGATVRLPVHLVRAPLEPIREEIAAIYDTLMPIVTSAVARNGSWHLLPCIQAWEGNPSHESFFAYLLENDAQQLLVVVNYTDTQGQCYIDLNQVDITNRSWFTGELELRDKLSSEHYRHSGSNILARGLYIDTGPWRAHIFEIFEVS